jgi:hypothetical protein
MNMHGNILGARLNRSGTRDTPVMNEIGNDFLKPLGSEIWLNTGPVADFLLKIDGKTHFRFLDRLYLPSATHDLNIDQVLIVNRYRQGIFALDPQFGYNQEIKNLMKSLIYKNCDSVLEIGPSISPIFQPDDFGNLVLCDIDEEVNFINEQLGYKVKPPKFLENLECGQFDALVASFVFQFSMTNDQIKQMSRLIADNGVIIFNVLTKFARTRTRSASQFSRYGLRFYCIDLQDRYGKDDVLFVGSKDGSFYESGVMRKLREDGLIWEVES